MAEVVLPPKLLYIVVEDEQPIGGGSSSSSFRYTRWVLRSTLQFMGCKARHAFKISSRVFEMTRIDFLYKNASKSDAGDTLDEENPNTSRTKNEEDTDTVCGMPFELYKRQTTVVVSRDFFLDTVCEAMSLYKYIGPNQRADLLLACRIRERKESMTVLLCGTSGCGKSTLSSLLGSRLGITKVISTDSIRHMMRSFVDEKQNPLLWASTYHAGEFLDPVAVSEAKAKRKAKKLAVIKRPVTKQDVYNISLKGKSNSQSQDSAGTELIGKKRMAVEGFKAQSEMVIDSLDRLITAWEERKESVIIEGVHLSLNFVMGLMKKHPSIIPFMVYITNEEKHLERFAVRAKYMTLDPAKNKYVKYIKNIRTIQDYLCNRADKHLVPKINNTNVDRSVTVIHATVFSCIRRRIGREQLYEPKTNTVAVVNEEYRNQLAANFRSSKGMFQLIQRKGSSRRLMALLNTDGSVAKAWPVEPNDGNQKPTAKEKCIGNPMYGPLQIGKAEPVNLPFGFFGISAWPSDTGGPSRAGSIDGSMGDELETGSRHFSSCCSSPKATDGASKELKEDFSVSGSEEEADDDPRSADSDDDDLSDTEFNNHEEVEGSVDENSTKSDEEFEDLAIRDCLDNDYWTDEDNNATPKNGKKPREYKKVVEYNPGSRRDDEDGISRDKYQSNLNLFYEIRERATRPCSHSLLSKGSERSHSKMRKRSLSDSMRFQSRAQKHLEETGVIYRGSVLSGAPQ